MGGKNEKNLEELIKTSDLDQFYMTIATNMSPQEKKDIKRDLEDKSCMNCLNGSCRVQSFEKVGVDHQGYPKGYNCVGWENNFLIGKSKVLQKKRFIY